VATISLCRIERIFRELVWVIHTRSGTTLTLNGERIGRKCEGIDVRIPEDVESERARQIGRDLETAFRAMEYSYVIAHLLGFDIVPENEQQAASAEFRGMGYEIEVSPDRRTIRQTRIAGTPLPGIETARTHSLRMASLLPSIRGRRPRFEILAISEGFSPEIIVGAKM